MLKSNAVISFPFLLCQRYSVFNKFYNVCLRAYVVPRNTDHFGSGYNNQIIKNYKVDKK